MIDKTTRDALLYFKLHQSESDDEEDGGLAIKVQYFALIFTAFLIVNNI